MSAPTIALIYAHPYASRSLANRELLKSIDDLAFVAQRHLYDLYPDFDIDLEAEQRMLEEVDLVVLQHPVYWYSMPSLLKQWIDEVFAIDWAYGSGSALAGKSMQWVMTTGADFRAYAPDGPHGHPFEVFVQPMRQTARFCGMTWLDPIVVHDAHADQAQVASAGQRYRQRLIDFDATHAPRESKKQRIAPASDYLAGDDPAPTGLVDATSTR